jgi:TRAP-type transport system periplasmic protein
MALANAAEPEYIIKYATAGVPKDPHTQALYTFKREIEMSTNGRIKVEIYHSGSLFTADAFIPQMIRGNLEMANASAATYANQLPYVSVFSAGYLFENYDHAMKIFDGEIGEELFNKIANELGVRPLGAFYLGVRNVNLSIDKEIYKPEDLKGVKLRMPGSKAFLFLGEALGANPTPLSFGEVYMALKTGAIDGEDNPLPTVKNSNFYEVIKTINLTNHVVNFVWPSISENLWKKLGIELQEKIKKAIKIAQKECNEINLTNELELLGFFKSEGIKIIKPDIKTFSSHVRQKYMENKEMVSSWDMDLYNKIINERIK